MSYLFVPIMMAVLCWSSLGWGQPASPVVLQSPHLQALANFGRAITTGDVNGDGYADVIVGAPFANLQGAVSAGQVFIFLGPDLTTAVTLNPPIPQGKARFGRALATADINGDGLTDLVIGAPNADVGDRTYAGQAFVFLAPDFTTPVILQAPFPQDRAQFGWAVAAGDINGDGWSDIVLGATLADIDTQTDAGQAFIFLGPDLSAVSSLTAPLPITGEQFGRAVTIGDLDGDGQADIVIGAPFANDTVSGCERSGRVFIFRGGANFDTTANASLENPRPTPEAWFGRELATGDVNGDGLKDLVIGAPHATVDSLEVAGQAFVFWAPDLANYLFFADPLPEARVSFSKGLTTGDVNGDGLADVIIGAPQKDVSRITDAGQAFVFLGSNLLTVVTLQSPDPHAGDFFGLAVAAGDINGDGVADTIVGAPQANVNDLAKAGKAFVFLTGAPSL